MPVPHDRPTFDQIMHALRSNGESGDILCTHAAEEIERLTLTDEERAAIEFFADIHADDEPPHEYAVMLRSLLNRVK